jgi:hypothetical protein
MADDVVLSHHHNVALLGYAGLRRSVSGQGRQRAAK